MKWQLASSAHKFDHFTETTNSNRLPMSLADMDFAAPPCVIDAINRRAEHRVFGYTGVDTSYFSAVASWHKRYHSWSVDPASILTYHGIIPALCTIVSRLVAKRRKVVFQTPAFPPFFDICSLNHRPPIANCLRSNGTEYEIDFDDLEEKFINDDVALLILCNPHNPTGRVWSRADLERIGEMCLRYDVLVFSDEIHADLVYETHEFTPFGKLDVELTHNAIIGTGLSKTFNLAGLHLCNLIVPDQQLFGRVKTALSAAGSFDVNIFALTAYQAAYEAGHPWVEGLLEYLEANLHFATNFIAAEIPQIKVKQPQATYFLWLDCRDMELDNEALAALFQDRAGVILESGSDFGPGGEGFMRMNVACPRALLSEALLRIRNSIQS